MGSGAVSLMLRRLRVRTSSCGRPGRLRGSLWLGGAIPLVVVCVRLALLSACILMLMLGLRGACILVLMLGLALA